MKIAFLHIGDFHFINKKGLNLFQIDKIVDALNTIPEFEYVIIVISGDIAYSGLREQYKIAWQFVGRIISKIKIDFGIKNNYRVLCVPGNHDIDHGEMPLSSTELQEMQRNNQYDKYLDNEIKKQKHFFNYAIYNNCFKEDKVLHQEVISFEDFKIEANLINSGIFSLKKEEDNGLHYLPQYCINELNTPTKADFVLTVMHHGVEYYNTYQKTLLESAIYEKSSIVFYGHEHYIRNKKISAENGMYAIIQAGGELCNNDNWQNSTFYFGVLDSSTLFYKQSKFTWNEKRKKYLASDISDIRLPNKPSIEKNIQLTDKYKRELLNDIKHSVSDNFLDYFVFPRLQEEVLSNKIEKEYIEQEKFVADILKKKKIYIHGGYNSGKSTLLKYLCLYLLEEYAVILYDASIPNARKAKRIIKNCFEDMYGDNPELYQCFNQIPRDKKILMIDNIDQIENESFDILIKELEESFGHFVFTSKRVLELDIKDRMKEILEIDESTVHYTIMPFFADKRKELIEKVVSYKAEDKATVQKTAALLSEAIKAQRRFISLDPDFIIKYVEYYCNNLGDAHNNDNGIFNKVFEANITNLLRGYQSANLSVDKLFVLLSKIAYYIHFNKAYPISEKEISIVIDEYNDNYDAKVRVSDIINIVTEAKILICDSSGDYRFSNRNYLSYFVAREINKKYNETGNDTDLKTILGNACFGINADVLMFISYITDNIRIQRFILNMTMSLTNEWLEFDFKENIPEYLKKGYQIEIETPTEKDSERVKKDEIEREKELNGNDDIKQIDIYDYTDSEADEFINQIIRASSLLMIVARCLPNFEHSMLREDKEAFVEAIYSLPNKIFAKWSNSMNECVEEYIQYFKEQCMDQYTRKKDGRNKNNDEDKNKEKEIMFALQNSSISLLLDLYNMTAYYSTKENTLEYLSKHEYEEKETYKLEHLMMLSRMKKYTQFKNAAISMNKESTDLAFSVALKKIIQHELVCSDGMDHNITNMLLSEFFPNKQFAQKLKQHKLANENKKRE